MRSFYVTVRLVSAVLLASLTVFAQTPSSKEPQKEAEAKRAELRRKSLVPSKDERLKYAGFLKSRNTGLIRLLPREKYYDPAYRGYRTPPVATFARKNFEDQTSNVVSASEKGIGVPTQNAGVLTNLDDVPRVVLDPTIPRTGKKSGDVRGGGAYYSFTRLTHDDEYGTDITLDRGHFQVGIAGANYGFMSDLGDVPLESVSLDMPEAKRLAAYAPVKREPDARQEYRRFGQGAEIDGVKVKSRLPMRLSSTYLARAINYGQADVLVAFKVVQIDSDGSPLILWKRLKRYSTPQLAVRY